MPSSSKTRADRKTEVTVSYSDSVNMSREQVRWTPKGVQLLTKWPFVDGAEVEFAFDHGGERHCCVGVVVACHRLEVPAGFYETVLYFIETPCETLHKAAYDCRLAQAGGHAAAPVRLPGTGREKAPRNGG